MINFILFHRGNKLPEHISTCIKQIQKTQSNYKIYFLTDQSHFKFQNVETINLDCLSVLELDDVNYYTTESDPLWRTSFERFFYINAFITSNNINNIVHFDNDVLLFHNVNSIITELKENIRDIALTKHKDNEYVCGFMFIKNSNSLMSICDNLLSLAKRGEKELEKEFNSMPHEMRLLGHIQQLIPESIITLPSLPWSPLFEKFKFIFDPSTYGQFFGSTNQKLQNQVHPCDVNRLIDRYIVNGTITPIFNTQTKTPYILFNNNTIPIFNLHIHCKKLNLFTNE